MEDLECKEILCVHRPNSSIVSARPIYKTLRGWIGCLYNNVVDRLFGATSQSTNNLRVQMMPHNTNQQSLI